MSRAVGDRGFTPRPREHVDAQRHTGRGFCLQTDISDTVISCWRHAGWAEHEDPLMNHMPALPKSISTACLGGSLAEKLEAAASAALERML